MTEQTATYTRHNHVTRDIKPKGQCPACDHYHAYQEAQNARPPGVTIQSVDLKKILGNRSAMAALRRAPDDAIITLDQHGISIEHRQRATTVYGEDTQ